MKNSLIKNRGILFSVDGQGVDVALNVDLLECVVLGDDFVDGQRWVEAVIEVQGSRFEYSNIIGSVTTLTLS